jgi:hypothetical protein
MEYNYITSAALDVGLAICAIILFFCVQLPGASMPDWWGTLITSQGTLDMNQTAVSCRRWRDIWSQGVEVVDDKQSLC